MTFSTDVCVIPSMLCSVVQSYIGDMTLVQQSVLVVTSAFCCCAGLDATEADAARLLPGSAPAPAAAAAPSACAAVARHAVGAAAGRTCRLAGSSSACGRRREDRCGATKGAANRARAAPPKVRPNFEQPTSTYFHC